jgi:hypothetical protein
MMATAFSSCDQGIQPKDRTRTTLLIARVFTRQVWSNSIAPTRTPSAVVRTTFAGLPGAG